MSTKQAQRCSATLSFLATIRQDLRFAARQLSHSPGFAVTAILVFALGIAASTAIFAFVDATLVRPLPYREPSRLVALFEHIPVGDRYHISYADYLDWKRQTVPFARWMSTVRSGSHGRWLPGRKRYRRPASATGFSIRLASVPCLAAISVREKTCRAHRRRSSLATCRWQILCRTGRRSEPARHQRRLLRDTPCQIAARAVLQRGRRCLQVPRSPDQPNHG